jgi:TDG/mug DNA glycosylase family protein
VKKPTSTPRKRPAAPPAPPPATPRPPGPWRPTPEQLIAARNGTIPDILGPGLRILFCGINPSLYSAAVGHNFARPGNRFWPALHLAGFTERRLSPFEDSSLLARGYGMTNLVARATATAAELSEEEVVRGGKTLRRKLREYRPGALAVLGIGSFRDAFGKPDALAGLQPRTLEKTPVWVLPNPSGLNAHYSLDDIAAALREMRIAVGV